MRYKLIPFDSHVRPFVCHFCLAVKVKRLQRRWCPLEWFELAILGEAVESCDLGTGQVRYPQAGLINKLVDETVGQLNAKYIQIQFIHFVKFCEVMPPLL